MAANPARPAYDCDTSSYWCSEEDYRNREKTFGRFIDEGRAYEILDPDTPRPWLNYLCNDRWVSVVSNRGLGFTWYKSSLLRITKYDHPIDYLPRDFRDGREILLTDRRTGQTWNVFRQADKLRCAHHLGHTVLTASIGSLEVKLTLFVPLRDCAEIWRVIIRNLGHEAEGAAGKEVGGADLDLSFQQTWSFARFGMHNAKEGIPYLSTPGKDLNIDIGTNAIIAHTWNDELPMKLWAVFASPQAHKAQVTDDVVRRPDGRVFTFKICQLHARVQIPALSKARFDIISGTEESSHAFESLVKKYQNRDAFDLAFQEVLQNWQMRSEWPSCSIPEKNLQIFLNHWLKKQLHLTFRFIRSGHFGYRDTLQDTWGYTLLDPPAAKKQLLRTLSYMMKNGSCPRCYSALDQNHDMRRFMDSGTWIPMTLSGYIKETGDWGILDESIGYLDSPEKDSVEQHVWNAMELLYQKRGLHGLCLTGDGDWNDALEGISRCGDAVSAWLTMALFHAQNLMADLYSHAGQTEKTSLLQQRSKVLKACLQNAWDGDWFVYGFTGTGKPIGSKSNREGKIHLNAQTWAVFTGLAEPPQIDKMYAAIRRYLDTSVGPALLAPPYVEEANEVGRIARLEPGTFENGSVYQHAVSFKIFADVASGRPEEALQTFLNLLPTNPENFDCRRTSEPYVTGNYYCGPAHKRFGQNFFTWFSGNPAWLLRGGFEEILGVKADYDGLRICPCVPAAWNQFTVRRKFRGTEYVIRFQRAENPNDRGIWADSQKIPDSLLRPAGKPRVMVQVRF